LEQNKTPITAALVFAVTNYSLPPLAIDSLLQSNLTTNKAALFAIKQRGFVSTAQPSKIVTLTLELNAHA
jgi:hypothetical protein